MSHRFELWFVLIVAALLGAAAVTLARLPGFSTKEA